MSLQRKKFESDAISKKERIADPDPDGPIKETEDGKQGTGQRCLEMC